MKISGKLFQNLTSSFREEDLRISAMHYSASSPHSPEPCLLTNQKFCEPSFKRVSQGIFL